MRGGEEEDLLKPYKGFRLPGGFAEQPNSLDLIFRTARVARVVAVREGHQQGESGRGRDGIRSGSRLIENSDRPASWLCDCEEVAGEALDASRLSPLGL